MNQIIHPSSFILWRFSLFVGRDRRTTTPQEILAMVVLNGLDLQHGQQQPGDGNVNGQASELIAGARTERARSARAAQSADQTTAFAALDQNQQNEKYGEGQQNAIQDDSDCSPHNQNLPG